MGVCDYTSPAWPEGHEHLVRRRRAAFVVNNIRRQEWSSDIYRLYVRACFQRCADWTARAGSTAVTASLARSSITERDLQRETTDSSRPPAELALITTDAATPHAAIKGAVWEHGTGSFGTRRAHGATSRAEHLQMSYRRGCLKGPLRLHLAGMARRARTSGSTTTRGVRRGQHSGAGLRHGSEGNRRAHGATSRAERAHSCSRGGYVPPRVWSPVLILVMPIYSAEAHTTSTERRVPEFT
jgi:hypothetical protein